MNMILLWLFMGALISSGIMIVVYDKSGKLTIGDLFVASILVPMGPITFVAAILYGIMSKKLDHVVLRKKGSK